MIKPRIILKPGTGRKSSDNIFASRSMQPAQHSDVIATGLEFTVMLTAPAKFKFENLTDNDVIKVQYYDGGAWRDLVVADEVVAIGKSQTMRTIYGPGSFRVYRDAVDHSIGVGLI